MGENTLMAANNFKPFAIGAGANVTPQADWENLPALSSGFTTGKASSEQVNKALRQGTEGVSALFDFVSATLNEDVLDNGDTANLSDQLKRALLSANTGRLLKVRVFTASGTYTPTPGTKSIVVEVQGGGGAGGGAAVSTVANFSIGGGGLSGAYAKANITPLTTSYSIVVGAGGVGVSGTAGNAGGNSSFGGVVTATGGLGGASLAEGTVFGIASAAGNYPSTDYSGASIYGAGLSYGQVGIRVSGTGAVSGTGGSSVCGSGGGARGSVGAGSAGRGYGSGGGGAAAAAVSQSYAGGNGTPGVVIIWEFS